MRVILFIALAVASPASADKMMPTEKRYAYLWQPLRASEVNASAIVCQQYPELNRQWVCMPYIKKG